MGGTLEGPIPGDAVFDKLGALGFTGSTRTARRALARVKLKLPGGTSPGVPAFGARAGHVGAVGLGARPEGERPPELLVVRLVGLVEVPGVVPASDKTLPTVNACLDTAMRTFGEAPTYWLTDNERTRRSL